MSRKKNRFLGTYIVVGIAVLLGVYVYQSEKGGRVDRSAVRIFDVDKEDITGIELSNVADNTLISLQKSGKNWKMLKPGDYELDKGEVEGLVNNIADLRVERKVKENVTDFAAYGLDKPSYKAAFIEKGKRRVYLIGNKNPTQVSYYVIDESGKDLYTAFNYSVENLKKDLKSLRKKYLTDLEPEKLTALSIKLDTKEVNLEKTGDKWFISPYNYECDKTAVSDLIDRVKNLKAIDFIEDAPKSQVKYGLESPRVIITAVSGAEKVVILVGKKVAEKEEDYVKVGGKAAVYSVDRYFTQSFNKTYNDFRSKNLLVLKPAEITAVEIEKGGKKIAVSKDKSGKFKLDKPYNKPADLQVLDLVNCLSSLTAQKFTDDSGKRFEKYGLKVPTASVALYAQTGGEKKLKAKLLLGSAEKDDLYVRFDGEEPVFAVSKALLDKLTVLDSIAKAK